MDTISPSHVKAADAHAGICAMMLLVKEGVKVDRLCHKWNLQLCDVEDPVICVKYSFVH